MAKAAPQHRVARAGTPHTQPAAKHMPREREARGSARDRGYSTAWDKFSRSFRRMNPLCEYCLSDGRTTPANVTDHDLPHEGDPDLFWNNTFTSLCASHHNGEKARAEARMGGDDLLMWVAKRKGR